MLWTANVTAAPISVDVSPVPLSEENPQTTRVDKLEFRGGLELQSSDGRFGGFSGLHISKNRQRLTAVSDKGYWFTAGLVYDDAGRLTGLIDTAIAPMLGIDGGRLQTPASRDAESIARWRQHDLIVGFERNHRLRSYTGPGATPLRESTPPVLRNAPRNGGAEAIARLPNGNLIVLSERLEASPGILAGWIGRAGLWRAIGYRRVGRFRPVGASTAPDGTLFLLERRFTVLGGLASRISSVSAVELTKGGIFESRETAQLVPPLVTDNFEGISVSHSARGETLLYIISDNNFNRLQRTLLLLFVLAE